MKKQKKYCRLITFSEYTAHTKPLFIQLSILDVYSVHKYQLLTHVYTMHNKLNKNIYSQSYYILSSNIYYYYY